MAQITGTLAAATESVVLVKRRTERLVGVSLTGTFTGVSVVVEASLDGLEYVPLGVVDRGSYVLLLATDLVGLSSARTLEADGGGFLRMRVRCTAISSGSVSVTMTASDSLVRTRLGGATTGPISLDFSLVFNSGYYGSVV